MKKAKIAQIINLIIFVVLLAVYVTLFVQIATIYKNSLFKVFLYAILGIVAMLVITVFTHEIGHYIFGKIAGLEFHSINVLFFGLYKDSKTKKNSVFFKFKSKSFGDTVMTVKNNEEVAQKVGAFAIGGLAFNFIVMMVSIVVLLTCKSPYIYLIFGITFVIPAYVFLVNVLPFDATNDGSIAVILLFGGLEGKVAENYFICCNYLMHGETPHQIPELYKRAQSDGSDFYTVSVKYIRYLSSLTIDENIAFNEINGINVEDVVDSALYQRLYTEKFFMSIIKNDEPSIQKYKDTALDFLALDDSPTGYRILATYYCYLGDFERAELLTKSGANSCDTYTPSGIAECERKYFEYLIVGLKK